MLKRRPPVILTAVVILLASACTTVSPAAPSPSALTVSPLPTSSVAVPSLAASVAPASSDSVPTAPPSAVPSTSTKTPKPPKSAAPSSPSAPNLVITKFVTDADQIAIGVPADATVTIKNLGTADADTFDLGISYARNDGLGVGAYSPDAVDGLAAGDAVQVTVKLSLSDPGDYTFTAQADSNDAIDESNEDDNTKTLSATAVSLANLAFGAGGFQVLPDLSGDGKYEFNMDIANTGTADVNDPFQIGFQYYVGAAGSGTLESFQCCTTEVGPVIVAGSSRTGGPAGIHLDPGDYIIYAQLDVDETIVESDETDNVARFDINVP